MSTTRTMYLLTALLLAVAAIEPSSAESRLSDSLEPSVESLATAQDYWSASKLSFQLANERSRNNEPLAACDALAKSLDYYRMALAKETGTPVSEFGAGLGDDEGMRDIRARFGCPGATA